jgi:preprotein translocase subunit SecG
MGVKQTTDVLERGTWIFSAVVALLCIFSAVFIPKVTAKNNNLLEQINTKPTTTVPAQLPSSQGAQPLAPAPAPAGTQPAAPQK